MARKHEPESEGNEGVALVEQDVAVDQAERELTAEGKKIDDTPVQENGFRPVSRFQFLTAAKNYRTKVKVVELPEPLTGQAIKVRELRAGERDKYENKIVRGRLGNQKIDMTELRIGLVIAAAVDWEDEVTPLFSESDKDALRNMGISVIQAIYNVASELSAVTKEDEDELLGK
jgi:hypothetical protein